MATVEDLIDVELTQLIAACAARNAQALRQLYDRTAPQLLACMVRILKRKALAEAKNHAEAMIHATDKAVAEHGAKVGETERRAIETAMADLKEAVKGDDDELIKTKTNALAQASMKLGEARYAQAQGQPGDGGPDASNGGAKEDVVDAEFTEVDDDKKNKKSA